MTDKVRDATQALTSFDAALTKAAGITAVCASCGAATVTGAATCGACGASVGRPADDLAEGIRTRLQQSIGESYRLLELLGRGGMGIVFRAREVSLDREVALKVLTLDPILNPDAFERFEREAKLAARLDHPNIVPIFAVGRRDNVAYYTMRLVRGGSVEEMLDAQKALAVPHALAILRDVAEALDYAHGHGIVHRDIKPGNILIGETGHALVADFGIAKAFGTSTGNVTGTGIIGSPGYMPPEQWRGDELDGRADQYALGVVAFQMLTGRRPFETPRVQDLLRMHLSAEVPKPSGFRPGLSPNIDAALARALAKEPGERFLTASAFMDALAGLRPAAPGVQTVAHQKFEQRQRREKRGRKGVVVTLALVASTAAAVAAGPELRLKLRGQVTDGVTQLQDGLVNLATPEGTGKSNVDSTAIRDSIAQLGGSGDSLLAAARRTTVERQALPLVGDSTPVTSTAGGPGPFRSTQGADVAYVRVVVNGGFAPVIVDGQPYGLSPRVVRVDPGKDHYVTVGAADAFTPSQIKVTPAVNDTARAVFWTAAAAAERQRQVADSAQAARAADSVRLARAADSAKSAAARGDSARAKASAPAAAPPVSAPTTPAATVPPALPSAKADSAKPSAGTPRA